ncbi:hypothetical protein DIU31_021495 [Mucilaginibacter rubeus]|uniref:Uncharacterized protein n=1 Tax=Mucilaginibacter rubeus TaxID=2027860 RepID=A0AAE6MJS0_9SPHI|nr:MULTISPECIES: hypothetical protein [Mucilaginibacter]QEM05958.1 hypothetical protein DIU31_021495 [Mucilaginibacter rubeus]QEM18538.1 hypothetical protein DIU38_021710 [Mucilaginibacter gossypii]QTE44920.1 hypothetical protein J3L19_06010 [Mucilaginibacter rubeus]QTE51517.1 hypothetical protein J3L21_05985 [Mucilaginibacter rubeus]QTE56604.1 hypothetical protein J3L23_31225 [Mucilaginibacter rubeus]
MKKTLILAAIIACAGQLKAQNLNKAPKNNNAVDKLFNLKPLQVDSNLSKLMPVLPKNGLLNDNRTLLNTRELVDNVTVYSRMPVVKNYPNDNMPVVKTDEPGIKYHMLIKKTDIVNPDSVGVKKEKVTP